MLISIGRRAIILLFISLSIILATCGRLFADVTISPAFVDIKLESGRPVGQFTISNVGNSTERYRVKSTAFNFSRTGGLERLPSSPNTLASWLIFNPKEFALAPKTKRLIRFAIIPRGSVRPGEYWAGMELESLNTQKKSGKGTGGVTMNMEIISSILVPIFLQSGRIEFAGVIKDLKVTPSGNKINIQSTIANTGTGRLQLTCQYEMLNSDSKIVNSGPICKTYLFSDSERFFETEVKAPLIAGKYKLRVRYLSPQLEQPLVQESEFEIPPTT